MMRKISVLYRS